MTYYSTINFLSLTQVLIMSPAQAKELQHKRYDQVAAEVVRGNAGYVPAVKSSLSKSAGDKFAHQIDLV
ncbi:hypothetical protein NUM25_003796 [Salmonella enterica]|nr:hypothetical protein [Salmonella enterica]